jgi:hypothetical protein
MKSICFHKQLKRSSFFLLIFSLPLFFTAHSQTVLLKKAAGSLVNNALNAPDESPQTVQPEPACACNNAVLILDLGSKKLMYSEIGIENAEDGSLIIKDRMTEKYFLVKDGTSSGPYVEGDPQIFPYLSDNDSENAMDPILRKYKDYITKSGEKYLISFNGKSYGPFAEIHNFVVTKSKDKFAASVVENIPVTEDQGKKMEQAIKNAKNDQEKMELAMKFTQEMQQKIMAGGGQGSITPKVISNIEGVTYNPVTGGFFSADIKYDDILVVMFTDIIDLKGNRIISIKPDYSTAQNIFVDSRNSKYAVYNYGTLNFSDGTTMSELFSPRLIKSDGKVSLAYLYYSPARNALMQCSIPF